MAEVANGLVAPLYADRHVLRAEDLTLDRAGHDAELARMRRLMHGWGAVTGLVPVHTEGALVVTPGYGVTPAGHEVFLPGPLVAERLAEHVVACCGPGGGDCELPPEGETEPLGEGVTVTAWILVRPAQTPGDLRTGVPEGCAHPVSTLLPSRSCGSIVLELACDLPDSHVREPTTCAALTALICGGGDIPPAPVLLPLAAEDDALVLGRVVVADGQPTVDLDGRHRLLPLAVVQDWLVACVCPDVRERLDAEPEPEPEPEPPPEEPGGGRGPRGRPWLDFLDRLRVNGFQIRPEEPRGPRFPIGPEVLVAVEEAGIDGPAAFLAADPQVLAAASDLSVDVVTQAQAQLRPLELFIRRRRF
jgi:hypothetical protein